MSADRQYATLRRAAAQHDVSEATIRNYITKGYFPVYKIRQNGRSTACVDLNEVQAALDRLPSSKARPGYGSFGPDAKVYDLSDIAQDFQVEDVRR